MDRNRLVGVTASHVRGSGYLIGPELLLTSAHVVGPPGTGVEVFRPGREGRYTAVVVWRGTPGGRDDAALVRLHDRAWQPPAGRAEPWGRLATTATGQPVECAGIPAVAQEPADETARKGRPPVEARQLSGTVNPVSGFVRNRYVMDLNQHRPVWHRNGLPWAGLSGAPLLSRQLIIGVIAWEQRYAGHGALEAVPAYMLVRDPGFRQALAEHGADHVITPAQLRAAEFEDAAVVADPPQNPELHSPAALLEARRQIVGFRGRTGLLAGLGAWCAEPHFGVRLVHGPGGQGKTRLAHRLAEQLAAGPAPVWTVLWVSAEATAAAVAAIRDAATPLLLVVDYAETRATQLADLVRAGAAHHGGVPVKLLLLARTAESWWDSARLDLPAALRPYLDSAAVVALPPLEPDEQGRREAYADAAQAFAAALPRVGGLEQHDWAALAQQLSFREPVRPGGEAGEPGNAFTLFATALADLLDAADRASSGPGGADGPFRDAEDRLLDHEKDYWFRAAGAHGLRPRLADETLFDAMAAAFLVGADDAASADALLSRVPSLEDQRRDLRQRVRRWIAGLYPSLDGQPWGLLQPDRLVERFVGTHLVRTSPGLASDLLHPAPGERGRPGHEVTHDQAARLLVRLSRAALHPPLRGLLDEAFAELCTLHPALAGPAAVEVATQVEDPGPLVRALSALTDSPRTSTEDLGRLADRLPHRSTALTPWATVLLDRLVSASRNSGSTPQERTALAGHLRHLCKWLQAAGRRQEALAAGKEAVALVKPLVKAYPDLVLPELAASLNNLAVSRTLLDQWDKALGPARKAVRFGRRTTAEHPSRQSRERLAAFLMTLATAEGDLGLLDAALASLDEGVRIQRELVADGSPGAERDLVLRLCNLANLLLDQGRSEAAERAAQEALDRCVPLAERQPDLYEPDLAHCLGAMALCRSARGQWAASLSLTRRCVEVRRRLAARLPETYEPQLAGSLGNLAIDLGEYGEHEEALEAVTQAVAILRRFASGHQGAFTEPLARTLNTLSNESHSLGDHGEARAAAQESVALYRVLARTNPEVFEGDLAMGLGTLAIACAGGGLWREAVDAATEAADRYRALASQRPEAVRPMLARALINLSNAQRHGGEIQQALVTIDEGVELAEELAKLDPVLSRPTLATCRMQQALCLHSLGRPDEAVTAARAGVAADREAAAESPQTHERHLEEHLRQLAQLQQAAGQPAASLESRTEALAIRRRTAREHSGPAQQAALAHDLTDHAYQLIQAGHRVDSLPLLRDAVRLHAGLPTARRDGLGALPVLALVLLSAMRFAVGESEAALLTGRRAIAAAHRLARRDSSQLPMLAVTLTVIGGVLGESGQLRPSLAAFDRAVTLGRELTAAGSPAGPAALAQALHSRSDQSGALPAHAARALADADEATELFTALHEADPDSDGSDLARALANRGFRLSDAGRHPEALAVTSEALHRWRELSAADELRHRADVAFACHAAAAARYHAGDRSEETRALAREAVALGSRTAESEPGLTARHLPHARRLLADLGG